MIDLEKVDRLFEIGQQYGSLLAFLLFDKRALLSMEQVAEDVCDATGASVTLEDLTRMGACGWILLLSHPADPETGIGIPLYAPSRITLLLELEREGYSSDELRAIAQCEEVTIDNVLTTDELAYIDDDLELVIQHMRRMFLQAKKEGRDIVTLDPAGASISREAFMRRLLMFRGFRKEGIPEKYRSLIAKIAFRVRALYEVIRLHLLEMDRLEIRAGYSPFIFGDKRWDWTGETCRFTVNKIDWNVTIKIAAAYAEGDAPTIRVPGFLLRGDHVVPTRTLIPREYEEFWKQHDLDRYLQTWSAVRGEKRCLHCLSKLPDFPSHRRMYCGEKCRNAVRQKRYRERNPEAVIEAQRKYWSTI